MANRYWVGGSGYWQDQAMWSETDGGTGGASIPYNEDDVFITANSGLSGSSIIFFGGEVCKNITSTVGSAYTWDFTSAFQGMDIYGNITLESGITITDNGNPPYFNFYGATKNVTSAGVVFPFISVGNGMDNTEVNFLDEFHCESLTTQGGVTINLGADFTVGVNVTYVDEALAFYGGTFNANDYDVDAWSIGNNGGIVNMGSGTWSFKKKCNLTGTIDADTSTLVAVGSGTPPDALYGTNTFYNLVVNSGVGLNISGTNTFNNITINEGATVNFAEETTTTISGDFVAVGTSGNLITIGTTYVSGLPHILSKATGTVTCDYLSISYSIVTGGATWVAGNNSVDGGNTGGWGFPTVDRFWVGGTGNWSSTDHWSETSGGSNGATVPTASNSVVIDSNSGLSGGVLTIDANSICADFTAENTGYSFTIEVLGEESEQHLVRSYSESNRNDSSDATVYNFGETFTANGELIKSCKFHLHRFGNPTGNLVAELWYSYQNKPFNGAFAYSDPVDVSTIGTSPPQLIEFTFTGLNRNYFENGSKFAIVLNFAGVTQDASNKIYVNYDNSGAYADGQFCRINRSGGAWEGVASWDLIFYVYSITISLAELTLYGEMKAKGTASNEIILGSTGTEQHTINQYVGVADCSYLDISNSNATGGATFYAGTTSVDSGGNDGWLFEDLPVSITFYKENTATLPTDDSALSTQYTEAEVTKVGTDDTDFVDLVSDISGYAVHLYKGLNPLGESSNADITIIGKSDIATSVKPVYLQIYDRVALTWDTLDTESSAGAGVEFTLSGSITASQTEYYDNNFQVAVRVYQEI